MKLGKRVEVHKGMKFSRLKILPEVLQQYFKEIENDAANKAYTLTGYEGIVFMRYEENGDKYVAILNRGITRL